MPLAVTASSTTASAMAWLSDGMVTGSTAMKSTQPAICVRRPSVEKRVILRMPDSPPASRRQFSSAPRPSDVIAPTPVTATARA